MSYKFILFTLLILATKHAYAEVSPAKALALQKLQQAIDAYGDKHQVCDLKKQENTLTKSTLASLRALPEETLREGIMHLSVKAYNHCLQPERGELAERLLHSQSWPEDKNKFFDNLMLITADSTRKIVFDISYANTEVTFYQLPLQQQQALLSIPAMQLPFDPMTYWEAATQPSDINKQRLYLKIITNEKAG